MNSKIACHYDDHDYHADNVKYVHFFAPIERTLVPRQWFILIPEQTVSAYSVERKRQMHPAETIERM